MTVSKRYNGESLQGYNDFVTGVRFPPNDSAFLMI